MSVCSYTELFFSLKKMHLPLILFDDCRNTSSKNGAHDERMLLFQASPHARDQPRTYRTSHPVADPATSPRHRCHKCGKHLSREVTLRVHVTMHDGKYP